MRVLFFTSRLEKNGVDLAGEYISAVKLEPICICLLVLMVGVWFFMVILCW